MNNTLSKEEVLNKYNGDYGYDIIRIMSSDQHYGINMKKEPIISPTVALNAMDEYAKQEVIGFDGWKRKEKIYHGLFDKDNGMWYYSTGELAANNTAELYEQYLLHKQNKEQ